MPHAGPAGSVAVLSDIHGVLPALEAVLAEPEVRAADLIVITGDHASGPQPVQVLDRLAELGDRVVLVRGNADRELVALARGESVEVPDEITPWAAAQLLPRHVSLLAALPHPVIIEVSGFGPTAFCHGTVRDDNEVVLVDTRIEKWAEVLAELSAEVMTIVCGHTHMPFCRLADGRQIVNPGSVGMPYGRAGAHWALLRDGAITLRRTAYDLERAERAINAACSFAGIAEWTDYFLHARAGDREVIGVFGPRDGRLAAAGGIPASAEPA
jgi:predicted phosphodiesterase